MAHQMAQEGSQWASVIRFHHSGATVKFHELDIGTKNMHGWSSIKYTGSDIHI